MFVRKSKYKALERELLNTRTELEAAQITRKHHINTIRKYIPWYIVSSHQPEIKYYFQIESWKSRKNTREYGFSLRSYGNHKMIMTSQEYDSKRNAMEAIDRIMQRLGSSFKPVIYDSEMNRIK